MPSKQGPRLFWRLSNLQHPNADLEQTVSEHLLNHAVQVLLPYRGVDKELQEELDVQLATMLPPDEGYQVVRASLADVLAQVLNTQILHQEGASVQALSLADRLESDHAVALTPDGVLRLAVGAETHSRLGLTGKRSPSSKERYNISLNLRDKSLHPGETRYAQSFLVRQEVGGQLKPLGLPREALSPEYGAETWMPLQSEAHTIPGLMVPLLSRETFEQYGAVMDEHGDEPSDAATSGRGGTDGGGAAVHGAGGGADSEMAEATKGPQGTTTTASGGAEEGTAPEEVVETVFLRRHQRLAISPEREWQLRRAITGLHTWLGSLACTQGHTQCNDLLPDEVMPLVAEDTPPPSREEQERRLMGTVVSRMWKGMLSQGQVRSALHAASALVGEGRLPWAAVHVWGFADAPVAWAGLEHGAAWGGAGESGYTAVLLPGGDYCVFRPLGPHEVPD
ncbi:hypothetical protein GPECTOR_20g531 [Gonium pectorale]|uniref:Uncharacterized protein n=1 Tax=Gonium pectorale TaxID=33097 RepID=A0A150GIQ3_GONPE|nr:hypothetical protein GPECTOR_20g531 [Gonium pectorale]|eukprot:KXZ49674.1 hypothetical protein GPECTOR_20g531 [Gonium pectorale]